MNRHWTSRLRDTLQQGPCAVITITGVRGSAPRQTGSRMLVSGNSQWGSIGGGNLEFQATSQARKMLSEARADRAQEQLFGLGPALNQCCGGAVTVLIEIFTQRDYPWLTDTPAGSQADQDILVTLHEQGQTQSWRFDPVKAWPKAVPKPVRGELTEALEHYFFAVAEQGEQRFLAERLADRHVPLAVFGAGHVARALVPMLQEQPFDVHWIDDRRQIFPDEAEQLATVHATPNPAGIVTDLPRDTAFLVMTHSHELDEAICDTILHREELLWLGLIGSRTKRRRFVHRLAARGHDEETLERLVCPVGITGINGKRPATIAVTILAQLLRDCVPEDWR